MEIFNFNEVTATDVIQRNQNCKRKKNKLELHSIIIDGRLRILFFVFKERAPSQKDLRCIAIRVCYHHCVILTKSLP